MEMETEAKMKFRGSSKFDHDEDDVLLQPEFQEMGSEKRKVLTSRRACFVLLCLAVVAFFVTIFFSGDVTYVKVATWNVAAINNNPFETWINYDSINYNRLMDDFQNIIENPTISQKDIQIRDVFTESMLQDLTTELKKSFNPYNIHEVEEIYKSDLSTRKIISGFLKNDLIGAKRLISMPDRVTNTFTEDSKTVYRPTPINCYPGTFSGFPDFWTKWLAFISKHTSKFQTISKSKYPAISEKEEEISKELQILYLGIFDSILVHLLSEHQQWQSIRHEICEKLNLHKNERIIQVLGDAYFDKDIVTVQEVSPDLLSALEKLSWKVYAPTPRSKSNQNSVVLANRWKFEFVDVSEAVYNGFKEEAPIAAGDLLVLQCDKTKLVVASFHGDTNGLATKPVVEVVVKYVRRREGYGLIFGLDANVYDFSRRKSNKKQGFGDFVEMYHNKGLTSTWPWERRIGSVVPNDYDSLGVNYTTYNARTYLQPQLNKASSKSEAKLKGDVNPKDFILTNFQYIPVFDLTVKDNTGRKEYIEDSVFPTMTFPSDHAILSADLLRLKAKT